MQGSATPILSAVKRVGPVVEMCFEAYASDGMVRGLEMCGTWPDGSGFGEKIESSAE